MGLATFHGGINWFEQEKYYNMIGAQFINHAKFDMYEIQIVDKSSIITRNLNEYRMTDVYTDLISKQEFDIL